MKNHASGRWQLTYGKGQSSGMTVWKMDTCYHTCRVRYGHLVPLRQGWLEDPASPHGSSVPFNDAVVVLKVKCHQLHLLIELLHAIQGRRKRGGYGRGPSRPAQASPTPRGPPPSLSLFLPPRHGMWLNPSALSPKLSTLPPHSSPYTHTHTHTPLPHLLEDQVHWCRDGISSYWEQ